MTITAVIDRIEGENAILLSDEMGIEISIPVGMLPEKANMGELITLKL